MDILALSAVFIPLLPVMVIFWKKAYHRDHLNFLMILCLLNFIKGFIGLTPTLLPLSHPFISNVFSLLELVLIALILGSLFPGKTKTILAIAGAGALSSILTYYLITGMDGRNAVMEILQDSLVVLLAVSGLATILDDGDLHIFRLPLFWIATGTLFYFAIALLVGAVGIVASPGGSPAANDSAMMLDIAALVRYAFYLLAAWFGDKPRQQEPDGY